MNGDRAVPLSGAIVLMNLPFLKGVAHELCSIAFMLVCASNISILHRQLVFQSYKRNVNAVTECDNWAFVIIMLLFLFCDLNENECLSLWTSR